MMEKPLISFDYAIKYLLRHKGDYDIIEGFLSALFATEGYPPVKINAILDSESNKEAKDQKKSIADLVVEDAAGNKYVVEIDRSFTTNFAHKACFNTSRLVVDSISGNQDYRTIKKIFHISLLYFSVPEMNKAIAHGQTIFHEIDTAHPVNVKIANQGFVRFEVHNVFPEYFFISIPMFDNVIHQEIDEWLYVAKNNDIREDFKSRTMRKVAERLKVLKMADNERNAYYKYMKELISEEDHYSSARAQGEARRNLEVASNLIRKGLDNGFISEITDLSLDEIEALRKGLQ